MALRAGILAAVGVGSLLTLLVGLSPAVQAGVHHASLHVAVETAAPLISALAAALAYGRFARGLQRGDLVLACSLVLLAVAHLSLSVVPSPASRVEELPIAWASVVACACGAGLMTAAAFMPAHEVLRPRATTHRWLLGCLLALVAIVVAAALAGDRLPAPMTPGAEPSDAFAGHPGIVAIEGVMTLVFGAAALGFTRRAAAGRDHMPAWFAIGAVLATFAHLNYTIHPSVVTDWFAAGDVLRLASLLCLLAGGATEIARSQRALAQAAVLDERRRIARDLHDETAQDLAFIVHAGRRLVERPDAPVDLRDVVAAAEQALESTRAAIADLARPGDEPLVAALRRTVEEVAQRDGACADVTGDLELEVPAATRDALCRLAREAATNAIRHGGASMVRVTIQGEPELQVRIADDGRGFDLDAAPPTAGGFGLEGMTRRATELGGELRITSGPGQGAEVLVVIP